MRSPAGERQREIVRIGGEAGGGVGGGGVKGQPWVKGLEKWEEGAEEEEKVLVEED